MSDSSERILSGILARQDSLTATGPILGGEVIALGILNDRNRLYSETRVVINRIVNECVSSERWCCLDSWWYLWHGRATPRLLVAKESRVTLADFDLLFAQQIADELDAHGKTNALVVSCDIAREADVRQSIGKTVQQFGNLHVLANNAETGEFPQFHECESSEWDRIMAVNVKATYLSFRKSYSYLSKHIHPAFPR